MFGYSAGLAARLDASLEPGSVLVVEEPDVVHRRDLHRTVTAVCVGRIVECEYQLAGPLDTVLDTLPPPRAVLTGVEYGVRAAARAAERFGLPGQGAGAAELFTDKALLRAAAGRAGLRNPRHVVAQDPAAAAEFVRTAPLPCVVKPTARHASLGVRIVHGPDAAAQAWEQARAPEEPLLVPDRGITSQVLVEELVVGREFSVEMLVRAGVPVFTNITAKHLLAGDHPVDMGHDVPAALSPPEQAALTGAMTTLIRATGYGTGVLHGEWIVDADRVPVLLECAARMPGDSLCELIDRAWGFDVAAAYLELLTGGMPAVPERPVGGAAIRFLAPAPGRVSAVHGTDRAREVPHVIEVEVDVVAGDRVPELHSSWDRCGHVVAAAPTPAAAAAATAAAVAAIGIVTEPGPG